MGDGQVGSWCGVCDVGHCLVPGGHVMVGGLERRRPWCLWLVGDTFWWSWPWWPPELVAT